MSLTRGSMLNCIPAALESIVLLLSQHRDQAVYFGRSGGLQRWNDGNMRWILYEEDEVHCLT